jgi:predicted HicB family RNase H-like nuclease
MQYEPETVRITLRLPADLHEWLRQVGHETRQSINSLIVTAVNEMKQPATAGKD